MSELDWEKIDRLFHETLDIPSENRMDYLRGECGADSATFAEVISLVASAESSGGFMDRSSFSVGAKLVTEADSTRIMGQRIGPHRIISELGIGGMGSVYLAYRDDDEFQQKVALKIVRGPLSGSALISRFRRERQILANLDHPNIARLLDGGTVDDGTPYFVMEYVRGVNVVEYVTRNKLSINERIRLFLKICDAVGHAHRQGIIHRDIKPTNVLVTELGDPKLLDFGIAKVVSENENTAAKTMTGFHLFTPEYSSPEQTRGDELSTATDIYSLGVLLFEILTAVHPFNFTNRSPLEIARIISESDPERPSTAILHRRETWDESEVFFDDSGIYETSRLLRGDLDNIVLMAMRKEPGRRYRNADELSADLKNDLRNLPVKARPNNLAYRSAKFIQRNRAASVLASLLICTVGIFAYVSLSPNARAKVYPASVIADDTAIEVSKIPVTDEFIKFTADGKNVILLSNKQLYEVSLDGRQSIPLRTDTSVERIAESPNGRFYALGRSDGLYLTDKELRNQRKITSCGAGRFSWSSDNKRIVFGCPGDKSVAVRVIDIEKQDEKVLTDDRFCSDPSFSPDASRIVFSCETGEPSDANLDIYVMNADGSGKNRITSEKSADRLPSWSPDGGHIAFVSNRSGSEEIYVMEPDGQNVWRLTNSRGANNEPVWSPDGKFIAFLSNRSGRESAYYLNVEPNILAEKNADEIEPAFSPDGKQVIFTGNNHGQFHIYQRSLEDGRTKQLTFGNHADGYPRYSPDGRRILFTSNRDGLDQLFLMEADGSGQVRLTDPTAARLRPSWSYDGKKIVFVKVLKSNYEIFTFDLFSGQESQVTFDEKNDDFPAWTADGRIVFFSDRTGKNDIYIVNSDGSNLKNLTNNPANDGQLSVSPQGKIVFNSNRTRTFELWMMNVDGSGLTQLTSSPAGRFNSRPQFSMDGTSVAYDSNENDREIIRTIKIP